MILRRAFPGIIVLLGGILLTATQVRADTISLRPVADSSIFSAYPNNNFGGGTTFTAGGRPKGGDCRGLLLFNVAANLPAGAVVNAASLRLTVVDTPSAAVNSVFDLNRLTASWGEGNGADRGGTPARANEVTWINRLGASGSPWATAGADFLAQVSASRSVQANGNYTFNSTPTLVADVQGWLTDPLSNFGWLVRSESEGTSRTIRRFGSRLDGASAPLLTIEYTIVPEPGMSTLLLVGLAVVLVHRQLARGRTRASLPARRM